MNIQFASPLSDAIQKMKNDLFRPFDISRWLTIGFTAFLAGLLDYPGGWANQFNDRDKIQSGGLEEFFDMPRIISIWIAEHPVLVTIIIAGIVFMIALILVFTWLSSRGKFMFLYNVVNRKSEVVFPWHEFKREGNSLFVWRLVFGLAVFTLFALTFYYSFLHFRELYFNDVPLRLMIPDLIGLGAFVLLAIVISGYILLFLNDFVVPVMFRHRLKTSQAWYKFMEILWPKLGYFLLYGLFVLVLGIAVILGIIMFGFFTCCLGFLLILIPYIGSVVLLPVTYTFRSFSLFFLGQFGDDFRLFPTLPDSLNS